MKKAPLILGILGTVVLVAAVVAVMMKPETEQSVAVAENSPASDSEKPEAPSSTTEENEVIEIPIEKPSEEEMKELKYLPRSVSLESVPENAAVNGSQFKEGNRRFRSVRPLTSKETHGELLRPRWSPDGLQMIASRPGYLGVYLIDTMTGEMTKISDENGFKARWSKDGLIQIEGEDGMVRTYQPDGTLESVLPPSEAYEAYSENDTIYVNTDQGAIPITASDDRYYNPQVSPDGNWVAFEGLTSGVYVAPTDGSSDPVFVSSGNNPSWLPDSGGLLFDQTTDDGHNLTDGDIYHADLTQEELSNLSEGDDRIGQMPEPAPSGDEVAFESDGEIYVGEIN